MSIIDTNLEIISGWEKHVGSDISGQQNPLVPDDYGFIQYPDCMKFWIKGKPYTQWLAALHRPLLPNTGHLSFSFELMTDSNAPEVAQAIEFDTRVSVGGLNYNFSSQINYYRGGLLQISGADGKWIDTNYTPGKLTSKVWHHIRCRYSFDINAHLYQTEEIRIGEDVERYIADPKNMIAPQNMGWKDSCSLQIQQDLGSSGGAFSIYIRNARYEWK